MDNKSFIADLVSEMHDMFSRLAPRETLESESDGQVEVNTLLKLALSSELEASNIAALWIPSVPEIEAKTLLAEQCADEMRHYNLIVRRLGELGEDPGGFDSPAAGSSPLFHYLTSLRTTEERIAAGPFACEAVAEVRNAQFIEFCHSVGDQETARLYEEIIQPEEILHHKHARVLLEKIADTTEKRRSVAAAMRSSLAIADELQSLTGKSRGLHAIPMS